MPTTGVSQFEAPSHARTNDPANIRQAEAKLFAVAIVIFRCLAFRESPARDLGATSGTLNLRSLTVNAKKPIEPLKETTTAKLTAMASSIVSLLEAQIPQATKPDRIDGRPSIA
jgi:hypothetical protein